MQRRAFVSLVAVVPFAGCTGLLGGGVDTTLGEDEIVEFDADEGAELSITVTVEELAQPGDNGDIDVERDGVTFRLDHAENGIIDTWTIEDSETFEVSIDEGGPHTAMIIGGSAHVEIE